MFAPEFADVVLNQTDPLGLSSSAVFQVGLDVCAACKNLGPCAVLAVIPSSANSPEPSSNLIVLNPAVESPNPKPLWNISRALVEVLMLEDTPGILALLIAVLTSDNAVPPVVTCTPLICMVADPVTVVPDATVFTGSVKCQALEPKCTQVLLADFL